MVTAPRLALGFQGSDSCALSFWTTRCYTTKESNNNQLLVRILTIKAKIITLNCSGCGEQFVRSLRDHKQKVARGLLNYYCKPTCRKHRAPHPCFRCQSLTTNPKFCSRSCSATINGSLFPKRAAYRTQRKCTRCGSDYQCSSGHTSPLICQHCVAARVSHRIKPTTKIGYLIKRPSIRKLHPSWRHSEIRIYNRVWNSALLSLPCANCGYAKHVELCHIRPIATFKLSATMGEVNHINNVVQLCRNCHWELDHKLLAITVHLDGSKKLEAPARIALA